MTVETLVAACKRILPELEWVGDAATLPYDAAEGFLRTEAGLRAVCVVCHDASSELTFAELFHDGRWTIVYSARNLPGLLGFALGSEERTRAAA